MLKKGLVVTLGVALTLAVAPSFAEAPVLSCIPDIVISDLETGGQTADSNMWIFTNALDLDDLVTDADTPVDTLRWSFVETGGNTIEINGVGSNTSGDVIEPGDFDIRAGTDGMADIENVAMTQGAADMVTSIEMFVSDGVASDSATVQITTVDTTGAATDPGDELQPKVLRSYTFDSGAQGWTTFGITPQQAAGFQMPTLTASGSALRLQEGTANKPAGTLVVFGAWESPKDPATGVQPKLGCVMRGRYTLSSEGVPTPAQTPGYRLRSITKTMEQIQGGTAWEIDWTSKNFVDDTWVMFRTYDVFQDSADYSVGTQLLYSLLVFPQQVPELLLDENTVTMFTVDLLDTDVADPLGIGTTDQGTLILESLVVDAFDRPEIGKGATVDALTTTSFAAATWQGGTKTFDATGNATGIVANASNGDLTISVLKANLFYEAWVEMKPAAGVALTAGNYYRFAWMLTSTETTNDTAAPRIRAGLISQTFNFAATKEMAGGALYAQIATTPDLFEHWVEAPAAQDEQGNTELMQLRFATFQTNPALGGNYPITQDVAGTLKAVDLTTEEFAPAPFHE